MLSLSTNYTNATSFLYLFGSTPSNAHQDFLGGYERKPCRAKKGAIVNAHATWVHVHDASRCIWFAGGNWMVGPAQKLGKRSGSALYRWGRRGGHGHTGRGESASPDLADASQEWNLQVELAGGAATGKKRRFRWVHVPLGCVGGDAGRAAFLKAEAAEQARVAGGDASVFLAGSLPSGGPQGGHEWLGEYVRRPSGLPLVARRAVYVKKDDARKAMWFVAPHGRPGRWTAGRKRRVGRSHGMVSAYDGALTPEDVASNWSIWRDDTKRWEAAPRLRCVGGAAWRAEKRRGAAAVARQVARGAATVYLVGGDEADRSTFHDFLGAYDRRALPAPAGAAKGGGERNRHRHVRWDEDEDEGEGEGEDNDEGGEKSSQKSGDGNGARGSDGTESDGGGGRAVYARRDGGGVLLWHDELSGEWQLGLVGLAKPAKPAKQAKRKPAKQPKQPNQPKQMKQGKGRARRSRRGSGRGRGSSRGHGKGHVRRLEEDDDISGEASEDPTKSGAAMETVETVREALLTVSDGAAVPEAIDAGAVWRGAKLRQSGSDGRRHAPTWWPVRGLRWMVGPKGEKRARADAAAAAAALLKAGGSSVFLVGELPGRGLGHEWLGEYERRGGVDKKSGEVTLRMEARRAVYVKRGDARKAMWYVPPDAAGAASGGGGGSGGRGAMWVVGPKSKVGRPRGVVMGDGSGTLAPEGVATNWSIWHGGGGGNGGGERGRWATAPQLRCVSGDDGRKVHAKAHKTAQTLVAKSALAVFVSGGLPARRWAPFAGEYERLAASGQHDGGDGVRALYQKRATDGQQHRGGGGGFLGWLQSLLGFGGGSDDGGGGAPDMAIWHVPSSGEWHLGNAMDAGKAAGVLYVYDPALVPHEITAAWRVGNGLPPPPTGGGGGDAAAAAASAVAVDVSALHVSAGPAGQAELRADEALSKLEATLLPGWLFWASQAAVVDGVRAAQAAGARGASIRSAIAVARAAKVPAATLAAAESIIVA